MKEDIKICSYRSFQVYFTRAPKCSYPGFKVTVILFFKHIHSNGVFKCPHKRYIIAIHSRKTRPDLYRNYKMWE